MLWPNKYYKHSEPEVEGDLQVRNDPEIKRVQVPHKSIIAQCSQRPMTGGSQNVTSGQKLVLQKKFI